MNPIITSHRASEHYDAVNNCNYKLLQLKLAQNAESEDKYSFLKPATCGSDRQYKVLEKRKACWVQFLINAYNAGVDVSTLPDLKGCGTINYSGMLLD